MNSCTTKFASYINRRLKLIFHRSFTLFPFAGWESTAKCINIPRHQDEHAEKFHCCNISYHGNACYLKNIVIYFYRFCLVAFPDTEFLSIFYSIQRRTFFKMPSPCLMVEYIYTCTRNDVHEPMTSWLSPWITRSSLWCIMCLYPFYMC